MNGSIKHQETDSHSAEQNIRNVGDEELLSQIAQGDRQAFSRLYLKYQPRLVSYCARLLKDDVAQAADIVDDALFDVWRSADKFEGKSKASTWIYSIARNKLISWLRKTSEVTLDDDAIMLAMEDSAPNPEEIRIDEDMKDQLLRMMNHLTDEHRDVLKLTYFEDKSVKEVAELLKISENTVKTRMFYARKRLGQMLEKAGIMEFDI
ncbi:sigma-70 family RNA polymerase sigma factor [uncultured Thiothrix sp.]|jgi:RNA polymerase sigma-70 factor (ECF subfamily)|uniref:sigma-70 family RNA polymerase sigma factor n=1 Tax=uncultured Thiothrix sp. TaxID=223185 RepID=UPI002628B189|nr:sigma-70 family RNA polymerase sigma factor [uncultured Thiothrix sp.]HMT92394.1 sigma-70 family RNA polymerase sigma factor [Thiolinea sp.]